MTYNEKKSLYESIMNDVAKMVKRHITKTYNSSIFEKLINLAKTISKYNPNNTYYLSVCYNCYDSAYSTIFENGKIYKDKSCLQYLNELTDECFEGKILTGEEAVQLYKSTKSEKEINGAIYYIKTKKYAQETFQDLLVFAIKLSDIGLKKFNEISNNQLSRGMY